MNRSEILGYAIIGTIVVAICVTFAASEYRHMSNSNHAVVKVLAWSNGSCLVELDGERIRITSNCNALPGETIEIHQVNGGWWNITEGSK